MKITDFDWKKEKHNYDFYLKKDEEKEVSLQQAPMAFWRQRWSSVNSSDRIRTTESPVQLHAGHHFHTYSAGGLKTMSELKGVGTTETDAKGRALKDN
jgi:hypothetical protein